MCNAYEMALDQTATNSYQSRMGTRFPLLNSFCFSYYNKRRHCNLLTCVHVFRRDHTTHLFLLICVIIFHKSFFSLHLFMRMTKVWFIWFFFVCHLEYVCWDSFLWSCSYTQNAMPVSFLFGLQFIHNFKMRHILISPGAVQFNHNVYIYIVKGKEQMENVTFHSRSFCPEIERRENPAVSHQRRCRLFGVRAMLLPPYQFVTSTKYLK